MPEESRNRADVPAVSPDGAPKVRSNDGQTAVQETAGNQPALASALPAAGMPRVDALPSKAAEPALEATHIDLKGTGRLAPPQAAHAAPPSAEPASTDGPELRRIGDFQILRHLGQGGMGSVFLGYQEEERQQVAIKVLSDQLASNRAYLERFKREARSVAHLNHPNIVRFISVGEDATTGLYYLVLEYVDGPSAHALLDRFGRLPVGDAVHIILDVARALEHAHSRNIIHRDIKPDNILLTQSGIAKLADLGLAKRIDEDTHLTGARQGFGTPYYMPYEQSINARQADARCDIYALGATLYHLVTGEVPFPGQGPLEVAEKKCLGHYRPASSLGLGIPEILDPIIAKMLAGQPQDRYQTASELIVDLERSKLCAAVPSFVDPGLALQDPLVRERLITLPQPTVLDINTVNTPRSTPPSDPGVWYLRYRNEEGRWRKARASAEQIRQRLQEGRLSPAMEASQNPQGEFRPLASYPEFRQVKEEGGQPAKPLSNGRNQRPIIRRTRPQLPGKRNRVWLVCAGTGVVAALCALAYFFYKS